MTQHALSDLAALADWHDRQADASRALPVTARHHRDTARILRAVAAHKATNPFLRMGGTPSARDRALYNAVGEPHG